MTKVNTNTTGNITPISNDTVALMRRIQAFSVAEVAAYVAEVAAEAELVPAWAGDPSFVIVVTDEDSVEEFAFQEKDTAIIFYKNCHGFPTLWSWENIGLDQYAYVEVDVA